jgi:hypothetical protein
MTDSPISTNPRDFRPWRVRQSHTQGDEANDPTTSECHQVGQAQRLGVDPTNKTTRQTRHGENLAKLDWKPWKRDSDALSGKMMHELGVSARLAYATMLQSRAKLIDFGRAAPPIYSSVSFRQGHPQPPSGDGLVSMTVSGLLPARMAIG